MDISVDLPAPFSPSSASTSPRASVSEMPSLATRLPKRLVMPARRSTVSGAAAGGGADMGEGGAPPYFAVDLGWLSSTFTVNLPARISASRALTLATTSAGTFFSNVPRGASDEPLCCIIEYGP